MGAVSVQYLPLLNMLMTFPIDAQSNYHPVSLEESTTITMKASFNVSRALKQEGSVLS